MSEFCSCTSPAITAMNRTFCHNCRRLTKGEEKEAVSDTPKYKMVVRAVGNTKDDKDMTGNAGNCGQPIPRDKPWHLYPTKLAAVTEELAETKKDYQCLASLLDGHDATECRMNLVRILKELAAVTKQRDELQEWKESAMQVGSSWDAQAIGELIGVPIGCAILPQIEPAIRKLIAQRDILKAGLEKIATGAWCIKKCVDVIAPRALAQANSTAAKGGES